MIPTREEIYKKLSNVKTDQRQEIVVWLENINCPTDIVRNGERVNPREQILADLISYDNYNGS